MHTRMLAVLQCPIQLNSLKMDFGYAMDVIANIADAVHVKVMPPVST